jgi:hypothetical protein
MADSVQVVDLRASPTTGSRSRRNSLKKPQSELPQPQPSRGRSMSSAQEVRYANAVPSRAQSVPRTTPQPPPPSLLASAPASAPAPRSPYTQRVPLPPASGTVIVRGPPNQVRVQRGASIRGGAGAFVSQADRGKPRRSSSASRHTTATTTPATRTTSLPVSSPNIKLRNKTPKEQVMYIPSGQPLVIVGTQS